MCRALKVLCAAPTAEGLSELRRESVSVHWELVGGAVGLDRLIEQLAGVGPDVVVLDATLGAEAVEAVRARRPSARIVAVGAGLDGSVDASAPDAAAVRDAIVRTPPPAGPVRA